MAIPNQLELISMARFLRVAIMQSYSQCLPHSLDQDICSILAVYVDDIERAIAAEWDVNTENQENQ